MTAPAPPPGAPPPLPAPPPSLRLFAQAALPDLTKVPEKDRLKTLRAKFEELHDASHPLKVALQKLQTLHHRRQGMSLGLSISAT